MSDMDKIAYLETLAPGNSVIAVILASYDIALADANSWHILAVKNPQSENVQESYAVYTARFRMASKMLDDLYQHLAA